MKQANAVRQFLVKFIPNPQYIGVAVGVLTLVLVGVSVYVHDRYVSGTNVKIDGEVVSLKQLETEEAFFKFATAAQLKLKEYRQQHDQFPNAYTMADIKPESFNDAFVADKIKYEVKGFDYNYSFCVDIQLVHNKPCFDKFSFLIDPHLAADPKPSLSNEELRSTAQQAISLSENWEWSNEGVDALLTKLYQSSPDSAEFNTAYAWSRYLGGYINNIEYYKDDWDIAKKYITRAEEQKPDDLQVLRLQIVMKRSVEDFEAAEKYLNMMLEKHPDSEWTKYFLVTKIPQSSARITALKKLTAELKDKSVQWDAYWSLLEDCACAGRDSDIAATIEKMLSTFGPHPWVYQYKGNYLIGNGKYQEAIDAYLLGRAAGDMPALRSNLAYAYSDYGYYYYFFQQRNHDKAIEQLNKALNEVSAEETYSKGNTLSRLAEVYADRGRVKKQADDYRKAIEYLEEASEVNSYSNYLFETQKTEYERQLEQLEK